MDWKTTASAVVSGMVAFITYVFPTEVGDFFNSIFPNAGYYIVRGVFVIAFGYVVILVSYGSYRRIRPKSATKARTQELSETVPVASNAERLKALSPIHMMIMAIEGSVKSSSVQPVGKGCQKASGR
jgi:hypothetical protein